MLQHYVEVRVLSINHEKFCRKPFPIQTFSQTVICTSLKFVSSQLRSCSDNNWKVDFLHITPRYFRALKRPIVRSKTTVNLYRICQNSPEGSAIHGMLAEDEHLFASHATRVTSLAIYLL